MLPLGSTAPTNVSKLSVLDPLVQRCFPELSPQDCPATIRWNKAATGLSAEKLRHCGCYFLHLRDVIKCWPNSEAVLALPDKADVKTCSDNELQLIEETVSKFYCQRFYETFWQPPIIPHRWNVQQPLLPGDNISG
ncbi:hypothetical protein MPER_02077 [Moniliophthora perniciosa FA553]|nr:hypothetical protein MPER_02077 [Moniliophthora perniciosa FA553]